LWTDGQTDGRTDGQTGIKPIVPSGYTGRGLISISHFWQAYRNGSFVSETPKSMSICMIYTIYIMYSTAEKNMYFIKWFSWYVNHCDFCKGCYVLSVVFFISKSLWFLQRMSRFVCLFMCVCFFDGRFW
jgi:hypothetical protein